MSNDKTILVLTPSENSSENQTFSNKIGTVFEGTYQYVVDRNQVTSNIQGGAYDGIVAWLEADNGLFANTSNIGESDLPFVSVRNTVATNASESKNFFVGSDYVQAGVAQAGVIINEEPENGVLVLYHANVSSSIKIKEGLVSGLQNNNVSVTVLNLATYNSEASILEAIGQQLATNEYSIITCYKDALAFTLLPLCEQHPNLRLVGFGGTEQWKNYVQNGGDKVIASYKEDYEKFGECAAEIMNACFLDETYEQEVLTAGVVCTLSDPDPEIPMPEPDPEPEPKPEPDPEPEPEPDPEPIPEQVFPESKVNQSKIAYSCGIGKAEVNVYTGRMTFESPDISVGENSYTTTISHIYDSYTDVNKKYSMGIGWKLNIEQSLEILSSGTVKYSDSYGYIHNFEKYDTIDGYDKYFDQDGLGLTLFVGTNVYIEDEQNGKTFFTLINGTYRPTRIVSGVHDDIAKIIEYDTEGKITGYYDERTPERKFVLTYDSEGYLYNIYCGANYKRITYFYDENKNLAWVYEYVTDSRRHKKAYVYSDKILVYALDLESMYSLKFAYDSDRKAINVREGVLQDRTPFNGDYPTVLSPSAIKYTTGNNTAEITYEGNRTIVQNKIGTKNVFGFNEKGFTVSILELVSTSLHRTLFKEPGFAIKASGSYDEINGDKAVRVSGVYNFTERHNNAFKDFFALDRNKDVKDYIVTFWVKLNQKQTNSVTAQFNVEYKHAESKKSIISDIITTYKNDTFKVLLDHTAVGVWQNVTIPINLIDKSSKTVNDTIYSKEFNNLKNITLTGLTGDYDIADVHVCPGQVPIFKLTNAYENYTAMLSLKDVTTVKYTENGVQKAKNVNKDFFVADSDVILTVKNMAIAKQLNKTNFDFVFNSGTKRISKVSKVLFVDSNGKQKELTVQVSDLGVSKPSFVYAVEPLGSNNKTYTNLRYQFIDGKLYEACTNISATNGDVTSDTYKGEDKFGNPTYEFDAYGVDKFYTYDNYGNLKKVVVSSISTSEKITTSYDYDEKREVLKSVHTPLGSVKYSKNPLYGTLTSAEETSGPLLKENKTNYTYDGFYEKIKEAKLSVYTGNDNYAEYGKNTLTYNKDGKLTEVYTSENCKYGFRYDYLGRPSSFLLNGVPLLTKTYNDVNNSVITTYKRSDDEIDTTTVVSDRYGRISKISGDKKEITHVGEGELIAEENDGTVEFSYQDDPSGCPECRSLANIIYMKDTFSGQTSRYGYDKYTGQPTQYTITDDEETVTVKCVGNNKIEYTFRDSGFNFNDEILYDSTCLLSPRVVKTTNNSGFGEENTYEYDELGRYKRKSWNGSLGNVNIEYRSGTELRSKISYALFGKSYTVAQEYDSRGNITTITGTDSSSSERGFSCNYTYDDLNRLSVEDVTGDKYLTRTYKYNTEGALSKITENAIDTDYKYSAGRLTEVWRNGRIIERYKYDNCGNPTHFRSEAQNMWWERGTLLKKFNNVSYTYDGQGKIVKSNNGTRTRKLYHDGDKLIAEKVGDKKIRYFYDLDGVSGFKIDLNNKYHYIKDAQGNVVALTAEKPVSGLASFIYQEIIAYYHYDAFGNVKIVDKNGKQIVESDNLNNPAVLNPFRWKSQYYDSDTKLYYIDKRWYDPERGRFISAASPECLIENAATVFALNLYAFALSNPVAVMLACGSIYPSLDFYFDGELGIWERYWRQIVLGIGIAATIIAVVLAPFTCGGSVGAGAAIVTALFNIAKATIIGAITTLAIGSYVSGIKSIIAGNSFWDGFSDYFASVNLVDVFLTSFAFAAVTAAASSIVRFRQCFKEGTLVATGDGLKPIEEIEVGDKVLAYDETTGEQAYKEVVRLFRNETDEWYHITANGEELVCTGGHPFFVKDKGFVSAKDLLVGDILRLSDGALVAISAIAIEKLERPEATYNFEVADFHTYYVGKNEVLVHNMCERAAMRAAKRSENISMSQKPDEVIIEKAVKGANGKYYQPKTYRFGDKFIRNDFGGHLFNDGATLGSHFNAGQIIDGRFVGNGLHFFYGG